MNFADFRTYTEEQLGEWWKNVGRPINPQLSKKPTNNAAELEAVYTALSMSIRSRFFKKKILIKTDSQYSMDQLRILQGTQLAVEGRLLVAAAKTHCAEPFNPLHPQLS